MLVFAGAENEIAQLKAMLPEVDVPIGDVLVRGVLYEVQTSGDEGSAFGLALRLLGGKVGVNVGTVGGRSEQFSLSLKNQTIDAVFSALSTDTRFKAISKPTLRVMSGGAGRFTVGQDVPVLGAVTYPGAGQAPVQSVSYQSSGVIFDLQPVLHGALIDLSILQQVSNFVVTSTGVNASPTLIKRELKSDLTLTDGEVVVLGGLAEEKSTETSSGLSFLPSFARPNSANKTSTEILLILQVTRI
jgi:type II secretory pathway component GspD/PulD (secretin)